MSPTSKRSPSPSADTTMNRYLHGLLALLLLSLTGCTNELPTNQTGRERRIQFPSSLTLEKILGVTWKVDPERQEVILPSPLSNLSEKARPILNVAGKHLNSIFFSKTGEVYATYVIEDFGNTIFYYSGTWVLDPKNKEELLVRVGSPIGGDLEYRLKIRRFNLLNNMLVMEAFFVNPDYSFSALMTGKGAQDDYWSKETDVIDPSWGERNPVSEAPLDYRALLGSYRVDTESWKRVLHIDDAEYDHHPLLYRYRLSLQSNSQVTLSSLPPLLFGLNTFKGTWQIRGSKLLMSFPIFPFRGDVSRYPGVFESDFIPPIAITYARHDVTLVMEVVRDEADAVLVRLSEPGMISVYLSLHKVKTS